MDSKKTEIKDFIGGITQLMGNHNTHSESTSIMGKKAENATAILSTNSVGYVPVDLSVGTIIDGYSIIDVIAENTGEATLLLGVKDEKKYVLKIYHKGKSAKTELSQIISTIESNNVIKTLGTGMYGERQYEVIPYFANGDLIKNIPLDQFTVVDVIIPGVNNGLKALHDKGIIHRDIKPSNIFFNDDKTDVVIGDFGISSVLKSDVSVRVTNMSRTFGYAAPEASTGFVSKESDYYSFGITLLHLLVGQDPFLGMTDIQILYQTINKKLDIPQNIPARLAKLIRGLTVKERADRWGYEEVCRWLNNEEVEIVDSIGKDKNVKPYQFAHEYYYNLESLSMAFASDWKNAKRHLYRGLVEKNILQYGEELAAECMDLKELEDKDIAIFRLIRTLNPGAPLCYKGRVFNDLPAVGISMYNSLPSFDEDLLELFNNGCFVEYLVSNSFDKNLIQYIEKCIYYIKNGDDQFYYAIMYMLCKQTGYEYKEYTFNRLEDLIEYISKLNPQEVEKASENFLDDPRFAMWIFSQGYTNQVIEWLNVYKGAEW